MGAPEGKRLAELSIAVRDSTIRRLRLVPAGSENWRIESDSMSFADLAQHIIDADEWLFRMLETKNLSPVRGIAGLADVNNRDEYIKLITDLKRTGQIREGLLEGLSEEHLTEMIHDERFGGRVSAWWIIVRGNLDHETHHRGQIAAYLRMLHVKNEVGTEVTE